MKHKSKDTYHFLRPVMFKLQGSQRKYCLNDLENKAFWLVETVYPNDKRRLIERLQLATIANPSSLIIDLFVQDIVLKQAGRLLVDVWKGLPTLQNSTSLRCGSRRKRAAISNETRIQFDQLLKQV